MPFGGWMSSDGVVRLGAAEFTRRLLTVPLAGSEATCPVHRLTAGRTYLQRARPLGARRA
jgi:hypothetical protein